MMLVPFDWIIVDSWLATARCPAFFFQTTFPVLNLYSSLLLYTLILKRVNIAYQWPNFVETIHWQNNGFF